MSGQVRVVELGDWAAIDGLLGHADRFMNPPGRDGGLYYPRKRRSADARGNRTEIEPMSGNVLLGYARLNVPDGLWKLYHQPWDRAHFDEPALTVVDRDVVVSRAEVVDGTLHTRMEPTTQVPGDGTVATLRILGHGRWSVAADNEPIADRRPRVTAELAPNVWAEGDQLMLRCPQPPYSFTLRRDA